MQEIICILDKSGSMQSVATDALGGFNKFIEDQKNIGEANLVLIWFDDGFEIGYEGKLSKIKKVNSWPAGGMTALIDAIGKTFNHVKSRFSIEKPEKVVLAILTDGFENSSREFTQQTIAALIKEHQEKYGWDIIFLAADQDAWDTAKNFNIKQKNTINYNSANTIDGFANYSKAVVRYRVNK